MIKKHHNNKEISMHSIFISGAAQGIGAATAELLIKQAVKSDSTL